MLSALPIASAVTSAGAVDTTASTVHVVNALGTTDSETQDTTGPEADVDVNCDVSSNGAIIPVVDPQGTADDGSHTFALDGSQTCSVHVSATSHIANSPGPGTTDIPFECESAEDYAFDAGHVYKVVIEPIYGTRAGTIATAFPIALVGCNLKLWEDDVSILPNNTARFIMRQAACNTGGNFHILSVKANGDEIMTGVDACEQQTVELPQGVYDFDLVAQIDPNGDGDFNDQWTVFDPTSCTNGLAGGFLTLMPLAGCPTIDESEQIDIPIHGISLAHGEIFAFNFVDNGTGQFIPFLAGGNGNATTSIPTLIPIPPNGPGLVACDQRIIPVGANVFGPALLAGAANGAGACAGGGVGVIAGASTTQVEFDGNEINRNPAQDAFCTAVITQFQSTLKAETDYIATLTVVHEMDTTLETLVNNTDALVQKLLTTAPPAILPAVQTLTGGINQLNQGLRAAGFNTATLGQDALDQIQDGLANPTPDPERDAATAQLTAFITGTCLAGANAAPAEPIAGVAPRFTG